MPIDMKALPSIVPLLTRAYMKVKEIVQRDSQMTDENWDQLNPRNSVLFLGSGFSLGAKNRSGGHFMDGTELSRKLCEVLNEDTDPLPSLREISDDFVPEQQRLLLNTLMPLMGTNWVSEDQLEVIRQPWKRVYTTNYDDVFEFGMIEAGMNPQTTTFEKPVKKAKGGTQIVHLHGYIHHCDEFNIDEKLVLTDKSYVRQLSIPRPWFNEFADDVRFAQSIVFLGYSLADTPITALLLQDPDLMAKTSFIVPKKPKRRDKRRLETYGVIRAIGLSGFVKHLRSDAIKSHGSSAPKRFTAFEELNPKKDKKLLQPATAVEVRNLLTFGTFNRFTCAADWPVANYLIPRTELIDKAITGLGQAKTLIIHSRRSNGKSIFCEMLSIALSQAGWRCIRAKTQANLSDVDLKLLMSQQRLVLFFKSHEDAIYVMKQLGEPRQDMRFVVEVSTSVADVKANALSKQLIPALQRIDLNEFCKEDRKDLECVLDKAGILPVNFNETFANCIELRDFLIRLYENEQIKNMLVTHTRPLWERPEIRRAMVSIFALKALELSVSPTFKREIVGVDPAAAMEAAPSKLYDNIHDLFEFRDSTVEPFSSVVSQLLLDQFLSPHDLIEWALKVATVAGKLQKDHVTLGDYGPRFLEAVYVMGRVLQVSRLKELLGNTANKDELITQMFEDARHVPVINAEPLFWLQFAITKDVEGASFEQLTHALEYLRTAYRRGTARGRFKTYQLDTRLFRVLLRLGTHSEAPKGSVAFLDEICDLLDLFAKMLNEESYRDFVLRVLELVEKFVTERHCDFTNAEKFGLKFRLEQVEIALDRLPESTKIIYLTESVKHSISRSVNRLERNQTGPNPI